MVEVLHKARGFYDWLQYEPPPGLRYNVVDGGGGYSIYSRWEDTTGAEVANFWTHYLEMGRWPFRRRIKVEFYGIDVLVHSWADAIIAWAQAVEVGLTVPIKVRVR